MPFRWHKAPLALAAVVFAAGLLAHGPSHAQSSSTYTPQVGQEGKDVIWVPTPQALVERMLTIAGVTAKDYVVDLGSGDGRTVITAAKKFGARAHGIEYNPDMVELSKRNAEKEGVSARATFARADIFTTDFSDATVITMYLLPQLNLKLRPKISSMRPGTRVVSHAFSMDDWQPDQIERVEGRTAYLWIVPARVEGTWRWEAEGGGPRSYELTLRQHFQMVEGLIRTDSKMGQVRNLKLQGDHITFSVMDFAGVETVNRRDFVGRVNGDKIEGTMKLPNSDAEVKWTATRTVK
ncbi:MAG: class I SAM-dependent methyltransferase [Burkholderiales bacterium]|nr:class I SAM-dependent methyltransferase [Burkholderiales bacterium]